MGRGRNGKTVFLNVLQALAGSDNISSVPLQVLAENRFAAAELVGKLGNICGDIDAKALMGLIDTAYTDMQGRLEAE